MGVRVRSGRGEGWFKMRSSREMGPRSVRPQQEPLKGSN